ncbi:MAG: hypothetical protein PHP37_02100 [Patescibacteria group bacterium]|nr:hypothetical protein [Patescibacteria group bacterium]
MKFDKTFFNKLQFSQKQLDDILDSVRNDLSVAQKSKITEVIFRFSYDALLKFGMYVLAKNGYKIRSILGHHRKIIEQISFILKDENIFIVGDRMRR